MDYENYFFFDGDSMPGSARYYTNDKAKCSDDVSFIVKYHKKNFMWMAISGRAIFSPI